MLDDCEAKLCVIEGDTSVITFVVPSRGWLRMDCRVYLLWRISLCIVGFVILCLSLERSFKIWWIVGVVVGTT